MAPAAALAATTYRINPYRKTAVPTRQELHLVNRMGTGFSRGTYAQLRRAGGAKKWFEQQLRPHAIAESSKAVAVGRWFPDLRETPARMWERNTTGSKGGWEYAKDLANYSMLLRMYTNRPVLETMVDFWSNHLHVHANGDLAWVQRYSYDQLLRKHALGRFDQLLTSATIHPAMLLWLDNWRSVRGAPNENHGRELLELHTVGSASGYTEEMVKDSAKILSGYTVDAFKSWDGHYDEGKHTTGPVEVLGFTAANASADGRQLARDYLRYLAHHPATARTIARKLALRFVSDAPSTALVNHLAQVFRRSGTDIKTTLRALVAHPEFRASAGKRVRTPIDDFVATCRVLQVDVTRPTSKNAFAHEISWAHRSLLLYQWPRPDGPPNNDAAWASATRMLNAFQMHWSLAGGWWPNDNVRYRPHASWLPQKRIRLDQYVDHLCRLLHGRPSTAAILAEALKATGYRPGEIVTRDHALADWLFVRLVAVLLDSPEHMSR